MKVLYYEETRSAKGWKAIRSKNPDIEFETINKAYVPTGRVVIFVHFKGRGQQKQFEEEFNFHILHKDYEVPANSVVMFGPDRPEPILGSDFNTFIRKHKEEFKDANLVTIKRGDKVLTTSLHSYNACKQFLDGRKK